MGLQKIIGILATFLMIVLGIVNIPLSIADNSVTRMAFFTFLFFVGIYAMSKVLKE